MDERLVQINRCMSELEKCQRDMRNVNIHWEGPWLGYMDWLEELHCLVHIN